MITHECSICGLVATNSAPAVISPWIRELGVSRKYVSKYFICSDCQTGFFSKRYLPSEMKSIYGKYRESEYLEVRSKWEPWYSESYNENHKSIEWINSRVQSLTQFLMKFTDGKLDSIVDVGGDQGQFIPKFAKVKIVQDLSDKELVPGVMRVRGLDGIEEVDLIIYAHTLEHVANPIEEVRKLLEKSRYVYIEVPFGLPEINKLRQNRFRFLRHFYSSFSPKRWELQAAPSSGRNVKSDRMLSQSEHLTFFSEKSMEVLANELGKKSIIIEKGTIQTPDYQTAAVLQCLLTRD